MKTYNYELAPVKAANRTECNKATVRGTCLAASYGTATQIASERASELMHERGIEYGVVRVW